MRSCPKISRDNAGLVDCTSSPIKHLSPGNVKRSHDYMGSFLYRFQELIIRTIQQFPSRTKT